MKPLSEGTGKGKQKTKPPLSFLSTFKNTKPEGTGKILKIEEIGFAIAAEYIARRGVNTKLGNSKALDVKILERSDGGELGEFTIFESSHLTAIFDKYDLKRGDVFYLRLDSIDDKTRFKRYAFKLISDGNGNRPPGDDDVPF